MKINLDLLSSSFTISTIAQSIHSTPESENLDLNSPKTFQNKSFRKFNYLNFWNRLIFAPESFPPGHNTPIHTMVEQQISISSIEIIGSVLSEKYGFPLHSITLSNAVEDSRMIYHEDYPYNFVIEYKGERLGMVVLDFCSTSKEEASPIYRFHPHIKSFQDLP